VLARAAAFGIPGETIDGNDLIAVCEAAARIAADMRSTRRPRFLHATTYRWRGHLALDKGLYRDPGELERWRTLDPLVRAAAWLESRGVAAHALEADRKSVSAHIASAVAVAEAEPWPESHLLFMDVQDVGAPT
jgi:pyruvate dehydrogenase E1 component alpha subunit